MIKEVISGGLFVNVSGGGNYTPYINMSNPSAGMTRWNGNTNNLEVYDGMSWMTISSNVATVSLNNDAVRAITWANDKMNQEIALEALAKEHPAINLALDNVKKAKTQLDAIIILSKEHDTSTS
jgi:hypothetical protein